MPRRLNEVAVVQQPDLPFAPPLKAAKRARSTRADLQDLAYIALRLALWLLMNGLAVLGCAVALFLIISHGNMPAFFAHLENLSSRFGAADLTRQMRFANQLVQGFWLAFVVMSVMRAPSLVAQLRLELSARRHP